MRSIYYAHIVLNICSRVKHEFCLMLIMLTPVIHFGGTEIGDQIIRDQREDDQVIG